MRSRRSEAPGTEGKRKTGLWGVHPIIALIALFVCVSNGHAASVTLLWDNNPESDVVGYRLFYGHESRDYTEVINVGNVNRFTVKNLDARTDYYFAVTAYNQQQLESGFSNEVYFRARSAREGEISRGRRPKAIGAVLTTYQDTPIAGVLQAVDSNSAVLEFSIMRQGKRGSAVMTDSTSGDFTYTPASGAIGPDNFRFRVNNGELSSNTATVKVRILPPPASSTASLARSSEVSAGRSVVACTPWAAAETDTHADSSNSRKGREVMEMGAISIHDLEPASLQKIDRYVLESLAQGIEGAFTWKCLLDSGMVDFLSIGGFNVLLPIQKDRFSTLEVLRWIISEEDESLTIFLEDTTDLSGRIAVCDRVPGEEWYIASIYREWTLADDSDE